MDSNTRVIKDNKELDININLKENDYVLTSAVIDPFTKSNISTYIVKDNAEISFTLSNMSMQPFEALLRNYYYRTLNNKSIKIRCLDTLYFSGTNINIVPNAAYSILKATNRLNGCIFIFQFDYKVLDENNNIIDKTLNYAFKIVSDREFKMYKDMEEYNAVKAYNDRILRPKKQQ